MTSTTTSDDWLLEEARKFLAEQAPPPHPLLRLPTPTEVAALLRRGQTGLNALAKLFADYRARVELSEERTGEPLRHGFVLPQWYDMIEQFAHARTVYCGGGKRSAKSEGAAWLFVNSCLAYPGGRRWILGETENSSQNIQQPVIYKYLPREWRVRLNNKESRDYKLKYAEGRGFSDNLLVLPTTPPTVIKFLSFNQDPQHYQGWKLGAEVHRLQTIQLADGRTLELPNVGWWADESMPLLWLNTVVTRSEDLHSVGLWTFSPLKGITPTIKEMLGSWSVIEDRPAPLLPTDRILLQGCRPGHMPYIVECSRPSTRAIFFFREWNPFGGYATHAKEIANKPEVVIKRDSYGWAEDVRHRAFPKFSSVHIVRPEHLPAVGTNYQLTDPAGARRWATLWVRVNVDEALYIYRDWPDKLSFGEWAIPSDDENQPDGVAGPAQQSDGWGTRRYRQEFLAQESVELEVDPGGLWRTVDPYRRRLADAAMTRAKKEPINRSELANWDKGPVPPLRWSAADVREVRQSLTTPIREKIYRRFVDPRAAGTEHAAEQGAKTVVELFAEPDEDTGERMVLEPAYSGRRIGVGENAQIGTGLNEVNELLDWQDDSPDGLVPRVNEPRLYVSSRCEQVLWMFQNYTSRGGEKGGAKDFADLVRYMGLSGLRYIAPETLKVRGGGSY